MNKEKNEKEGTNNISKPNAPMIGANGNIFAQMGIANRALRESGQSDKISEMNARVMNSDSAQHHAFQLSQVSLLPAH